jgi:surface carbohydrate biosynthesis protein
MNKKKNDINNIIFIPIEIKKRELSAKLFLVYEIIHRTNFKIIFGSQRDIFNKIKSVKNVIWFDKNTFIKKLVNNHFLKNSYKIMLDEEGPWSLDNSLRAIRINRKIINFFDKILLWGSNDLKVIQNLMIKKKKYIIFGHPKFDLLKKPYIKLLYEHKRNKLIKKYKKFVLIVSNFGFDSYVDTRIQDRIYKINAEKNVKDKLIKIRKDTEDLDYKNYIAQIELSKKIAIENPNIKVIYRPHPYQKIDLVRKRFGQIPSNLNIIFEDSITPWIYACEVYIHSGCTTSFEAHILKKKTLLFYNFYKKEFKNYLILNKYFQNDETNLIKYLKKIFFYENSNYNNKIKKIIFNSNEKNYFSYNFCKYLKNNFKNLKSEVIYYKKNDIDKLSFIKVLFFKRFNTILSYLKNNLILKTALINFLPENYLYSKEYKIAKFNKLTRHELINFFSKLNKNKINSIVLKKITTNVFEISKKNKSL